MSPPSRASEQVIGRAVYGHDSGESPYSSISTSMSSSGNYANIRINVAPPTPTSKEFDYGRYSCVTSFSISRHFKLYQQVQTNK